MNSTKKNFIFSILLLVTGIILLIMSALNILPEGNLGSTVFGMGCGLTAAGLSCSIIIYKTLNNPIKLEEEELNENDERNILIREKTNSKVYSIFVYIECGLVLISSTLGYKEVTMVLAVLVLAKLIIWIFVGTRILKEC